jgi:TRAP transporter TAXI family solute receptor
MQARRIIAVAAVALASGLLNTIATPADAQMVGIGGTKSSVVAQMSAAIAKVVSANAGLQMRTQTMGGTQQYIPLVNAGQLEFGIGNMYQTAQAYAGIGLSAGHKYENLRMVATLMPFRNGVLVANKSGMKTMADLKGKRIPYGFNAAPLFQNFFEGFLANGGLTFADVQHVPAIGLRPSWELFMQGKVDAVIAAVGGGPNKEMNAKIDGGIRYLDEVTTGPNAKKTLELLTNTYYVEVSPAPQYPAIRSKVTVTGYDFALWAGKNVSDEVVMKVVKALHDNAAELKASSPVWALWNEGQMAKKQGDMPYHPGAIAYYKKIGIWNEAGH